MNKFLPVVIIAILLVGSGSFYGGMKYAQSKGATLQNFRNLSPEERQQRLQQMGMGVRGFGGGNRRGDGVVAGTIIAKDDKSVTVKIANGPNGSDSSGSRIIFLSGSTQISKSVNGSSADLDIGKTVFVNGTANQDGSITADMIQLRSPRPASNQ